jgi:hypothetical protein
MAEPLLDQDEPAADLPDKTCRAAHKADGKRATHVSVRSDLLEAAREAGINLPSALERAFKEELASAKRDFCMPIRIIPICIKNR